EVTRSVVSSNQSDALSVRCWVSDLVGRAACTFLLVRSPAFLARHDSEGLPSRSWAVIKSAPNSAVLVTRALRPSFFSFWESADQKAFAPTNAGRVVPARTAAEVRGALPSANREPAPTRVPAMARETSSGSLGTKLA